MRALILAVLLVAIPARAHADGVIALLPLAADSKLELYGQPVASEVARHLEGEGFSIVVVTSTAPVPSKARLVIDGRIVDGEGDTVKLEARVRDPKAGKVIAELSASAPSLTRIDEAAADLATSLTAVLRDGLAAQDSPSEVPEPDTDPVEPGETRPAKTDKRPLAIVAISSSAKRGAEDPALEPLLHAGSVRLAKLVGHRSEDAAGDDLAVALAQQSAGLAIRVDLLSIKYEMRGVITARARARVRVLDASGTVWDRVVRTDTLVGGRGDRRDAVARAAVEQIVDIAMPRVREAIAARKPKEGAAK